MPCTGKIFLLGNLVDPDLAGIIQTEDITGDKK